MTLSRIKALHTLIWAIFAGCIAALPVATWLGRVDCALVLVGVVMGEVLVLALNRGRCPLTDWAARYTDDRRANFDIYLPEALARHNKTIFGVLFAAGVVHLLLTLR